ncbi:hypothetical protein AAWM_04657 [Aspergillus awamori]|uniref:Uncharacterized protein n=1 Tax=Aspergillus awamori TaxID=105351 RepID=A0A401KRA1_ASPAW|nr:hypothetical protein AAWM_04657 [Aspergillus awamori]
MFLQGVSGSASGDTHRKTHPKASEEAACNVGFTLEGAHEVPGHSDTPAHREYTDDHPIAPTVAPQEPVRTQVDPARNRPCRRWQAAAYGPRVEGPDPADTPTNGGSRGAAPPGNLLSTATRLSPQLVNSTPPPYKVATCTPHAPIRGHPRPSWRSLAASLLPSARVPPHPAVSPAAPRITHLTWQLVNSLRQHARTQLSRAPDACLLAPAVSAAGQPPRPTGARRSVAAILRANVLWSKVIRGGRHAPASWRRLARPTGQWPLSRTRARTASLLDPSSQVNAMQNPFRPRWSKEKEGGTLAHARESIPEAPPTAGAAGPQQGYLTAYTTRLVTSVVCRGFIPARGDIAIRQPAPGASPRSRRQPAEVHGRRPIRIHYDVRGNIAAFRHGF